MKNSISINCVLYHLVLLSLLIPPSDGYGLSGSEKKPLDRAINGELTYLLSYVGPNAPDATSFSTDAISDLLKFVLRPKDEAILYHAAEINGAASAYHETDIRGGIKKILRMTYNPNIPSVVTMPSTIRLSYWKELDSPGQKLPRFWENLQKLETPLVVNGIEHIVNSPDHHSGAYFEYDLYRTLILIKHQGRIVLISLSKQKDVSDVGKKGIVIGPDENWDYVYTGIPGVNRTGLGWVKSYMYDSYSVSFCSEIETGSPTVRFGVFKWVSAGFAGINLARSTHIYDGVLRFSSGFKQIIEDPRIADTPDIERAWKTIQSLPYQNLKQITRDHLAELEEKCTINGLMEDKLVAALFDDQRYLNTFTRQEMQVYVLLEHLKQILNDVESPTLSYLPAYLK